MSGRTLMELSTLTMSRSSAPLGRTSAMVTASVVFPDPDSPNRPMVKTLGRAFNFPIFGATGAFRTVAAPNQFPPLRRIASTDSSFPITSQIVGSSVVHDEQFIPQRRHICLVFLCQTQFRIRAPPNTVLSRLGPEVPTILVCPVLLNESHQVVDDRILSSLW